ncbi:acyltransferase family protein, partial [Xanthovirga aplysinae]|uniref:acyltransferase family protein n=1 Tax=Xanthovirga aplysinae TaxID=2529853 RepID=UPI001656BC33
INIPYFYLRRLLRIWPLYFFCLFFGFIVFPLLKSLFGQVPNETANPWLFVSFLSNINNIKNGLPDASILGVLWSVSIEEQFYLFWPLFMALFRKQRPLLFLTILIGSLFFRYFHYADSSVIYFHTFSVISDMALGGLLAWLCFEKESFVTNISYLKKPLIFSIYLLGILLIIFRKDIFASPMGITFENLTLSTFFGFIILEQNYSNHSFFKVGNNKFFTQWGKYTYGLYCLHFIGILSATHISQILGTNKSLFGVLVWETALALSISMATAWLSFHLYEIHFLKLKVRFGFVTTVKEKRRNTMDPMEEELMV